MRRLVAASAFVNISVAASASSCACTGRLASDSATCADSLLVAPADNPHALLPSDFCHPTLSLFQYSTAKSTKAPQPPRHLCKGASGSRIDIDIVVLTHSGTKTDSGKPRRHPLRLPSARWQAMVSGPLTTSIEGWKTLPGVEGPAGTPPRPPAPPPAPAAAALPPPRLCGGPPQPPAPPLLSCQPANPTGHHVASDPQPVEDVRLITLCGSQMCRSLLSTRRCHACFSAPARGLLASGRGRHRGEGT